MQPQVFSRVARTASLRIAAPPSVAFPLFGPIEEQRWAAGWAPTMIYPATGEIERGAVFTVAHEEGEPSVWTIVELDPAAYRIAYVRVRPASHVARIDIVCAGEDGVTRADVAYTFTALTEQGNAYVNSFSEARYAEWIRSWEQAIDHLLRYGVQLSAI